MLYGQVVKKGLSHSRTSKKKNMVQKARKYIILRRYTGPLTSSDCKIVKYDLPPIQDQEILVKVEWLSMDAYLGFFYTGSDTPYDQFGYQLGVVEKSKNERYPIGTRVISHQGWCDYCVYNPDAIVRAKKSDIAVVVAYKLPDLDGLPISLGIGAVGYSGVAAYFGFLKICKPKSGHTVVVTSAAGCIGTIVGQIAKIKGCTVIGFTGSNDKAVRLKKELNFDYAYNYKTVNVVNVLKKAAPDGIDCYFDNVGDALSYDIMTQMKPLGRVAICGCISYHDRNRYKTKSDDYYNNGITMIILRQQLRVEGFQALRWYFMWESAFADLTKWIRSGELKVKEHVTEGFNNVVKAMSEMLAGENFGKALVKV